MSQNEICANVFPYNDETVLKYATVLFSNRSPYRFNGSFRKTQMCKTNISADACFFHDTSVRENFKHA